jgi:hypothetical protein
MGSGTPVSAGFFSLTTTSRAGTAAAADVRRRSTRLTRLGGGGGGDGDGVGDRV